MSNKNNQIESFPDSSGIENKPSKDQFHIIIDPNANARLFTWNGGNGMSLLF
jgi:hypothetical protein